MRGMDHQDSEKVGQQMPSLFAKRYDAEYIVMGFILELEKGNLHFSLKH